MNKWKETLLILLTAVSFVILTLFIQPNEIKVKEFTTRIPKTTTVHYLLNTKTLFEKIVFNELFIHKDEVIIQKIKGLISKKSKTTTNLSDLSIDFSSPLEIIRFEWNSKSFTILKYKIFNASNFDRNQKNVNKELMFRDQNYAYWVLGERKSRKSRFQKFIMNNSFEYRLKNDESKQFVSTFQNSELTALSSIQMNENELTIEQKITRSRIHKCLKPKGFNLSTVINPSQFGILQENRVSDLIHLKDLKYVSFNYLGLDFIDNSQIPAIPRFEILLHYNNKIVSHSLVSNILNRYNIDFTSKSNNEFQLANQSIKIQQIDSNEFVISTLEDNFELTKSFLNPFITGDPKNIVKISNAGWKGLFLELIPVFKATRNLLESTDGISTYQNSQGSQIISVSFKKNEDALHALLQFALNLQ
jgi:hypothetical protein